MKKKAILYGINTTHFNVITLPTVLFFLDRSTAFFSTFLCLTLILIGAIITSYLLLRFIDKNGLLDQRTSSDKNIALMQASEVCFSGLLFIPSKQLLQVSDAIWSLAGKRYQLTVRAAMIASDDLLLLVIGGLISTCVYMGFHADFGLSLSRFAALAGEHLIIQICLVAVTPWISLIFLFNFFFRKFIIKGNL